MQTTPHAYYLCLRCLGLTAARGAQRRFPAGCQHVWTQDAQGILNLQKGDGGIRLAFPPLFLFFLSFILSFFLLFFLSFFFCSVAFVCAVVFCRPKFASDTMRNGPMETGLYWLTQCLFTTVSAKDMVWRYELPTCPRQSGFSQADFRLIAPRTSPSF